MDSVGGECLVKAVGSREYMQAGAAMRVRARARMGKQSRSQTTPWPSGWFGND